MKTLIGLITAGAIFASPCASDTSQRELLERMHQSSLLQTTATPVATAFTVAQP